MAAFAADRPLAAPPGTRFNYSSGTSNVISGVVASTVGPGQPYREFLARRLFDPLGMTSATVTLDDAGTWVAASYVYATARDFARFGLLYLRDGIWEDSRLLPEGWVDEGRRPRSVDPDDGDYYGSHWWTREGATAPSGLPVTKVSTSTSVPISISCSSGWGAPTPTTRRSSSTGVPG